MAKDKRKQASEFNRDGLSSMFEGFLKTASEYDLRALQKFLANKTSTDRDTKMGTLVVVAKTTTVRSIARSIDYMDAVLKEGKNSFGDPRKGDIDVYAESLKQVLVSFNQIGDKIGETTREAIQKNVGPQWAIKNHQIETIQELCGISKNQSEKVYEKYMTERRSNPDLDIETYIGKLESEAKAAKLELKDFILGKTTDGQPAAQGAKKETKAKKEQKEEVKTV